MSYKLPSEALIMRMQQLVSNLNITPAECRDSIDMMKMEAASIMRDITREHLEPAFTVLKLKKNLFRIGRNTIEILRQGDRVIYGLENDSQYIIVDEIALYEDKETVELTGTNGMLLKCKISGV